MITGTHLFRQHEEMARYLKVVGKFGSSFVFPSRLLMSMQDPFINIYTISAKKN